MKQIRSPFKFLDPFTQADRKVFFGRDSEIEALYRMVLQTPLLLLYGLSGTGKTSLVQCGLAGKFDGTDWLPFWIRREDDINRSLHKALDAVRAGIAAPAPADISTPGKIEQLYSHFLRPVFLIFDQFEELYVFGDAAERATFVEELKSILEAELPCTILLSVREEYLGRLYPLEKEIPSLFNFRMRVERMDAAHVTEVLSESFRQFNIGVEPPAPERYGEIIENVSQGRSGIELPYLQVYLDRLYREDHARCYPGGTDLPEGQWPPLTFSKAEIADFGTITDVLDNFLREQREALRGDLLAKFPKAKIPENAVDQLLDAFVSAEGTKRPISVVREQGLAVVAERQRALFPPVSAEVLTYCIERLEQARLLRSGETNLELAHDTLALAIEKQRSAEQRQLAEVRRRIEAGYREHADSLKSDHPYYFDKGQLARIEPFLPKLALEPEQADFLEKSRAEAERLENTEKARVERELRLAEDKLAAEERARKRQRFFTRLVAGVAVLALGAAIVAFFQTQKANSATTAAKASATEALAAQQAAQDSAAVARTQRAAAVSAQATADQKARDALHSDSLTRIEKKRADQALEDAKGNARIAVRTLLTVADKAIKQLNYAEASEAVNAAVSLEADKPAVADALLEMAFYHNHTGDRKTAAQETATAARWLNRPDLAAQAERLTADTRPLALRAVQKALAPARFREMDERYFPKMIAVKGGTFTPGCVKPGDCGAEDSLYQATVSDFELAETETTVLQYHLYATALGRRIGQGITPADTLEEYDPPTWGWVYDHPIIYVSWYDAVEYANWTSEQQGFTPVYTILKAVRDASNQNLKDGFRCTVTVNDKANGYRLPSEAEWEFAARGGVRQDTFQYAGSDDLGEVAWWYGNNGSRTQTVGGKKPNSLQLYDLSGNVWEWCWDWYGDYPQKPETNYRGLPSGEVRALRGGSWYGRYVEDYRPAVRSSDDPDRRINDYGFRVARH